MLTKEPTKYFLSTLPEDVSIEILVDAAKMRWRIERDYEELKSELGLAHFEGRGWRGFHHHATLCIAAYGFLIRETADFSPSGTRNRQKTRLPAYIRPVKPAGPARTPRPELDSDGEKIADRYLAKTLARCLAARKCGTDSRDGKRHDAVEFRAIAFQNRLISFVR